MMTLAPSALQAQSIGFESQDYRQVEVYDSWEHSPFRTGQLEGNVKVVANPDQEVDATLGRAINPSAQVLAFQRSRFASNIFGARIDLTTPWQTSPTTQYVHVLVRSPKAGRAMLVGLGKRTDRMDQSAEVEQFVVRSKDKLEEDKWVDAVFPVKTASGVEIHSLVVVPDMESPHALDSDFAVYLDDVVINSDGNSRTKNVLYGVNIEEDAKVTRNDRYIKSVVLGNQSFPVYSSVQTGVTPVYKYLTDKVFMFKPGQSVTPRIGYAGAWMDGYVYLDYAQDGQFNSLLQSNGVPSEGSDLVSYSYYSSAGNSPGTTSTGATISEGNHVTNSYITCPAFTIPSSTPYGFYRMRFKVDWNNVDAGGSIASSNHIVNNGGGFVDVLLNLHPDKVLITDANRNGDVLDANGQALGYEIPFGQPFTIKMRPENGFDYRGVRIRHGYHLDGDSLVGGTPQYKDIIILKHQFTEDDTYTIPGNLIDGEVKVEGLFVSEGMVFEEDFYPIGIDKETARTREDRVIQGVGLNGVTVDIASPDKMYYDLTNYCFVAKPDVALTPSIRYSRDWMHGYIYVDKARDGFFNAVAPADDGRVSQDNDLVSYSCLVLSSGNKNSAGETVNQNTLSCPSFTLASPLPNGFYRMRYKVDWDNYNPLGNTGSNNNIVDNGGGYVDIRLRVTPDEEVTLYDKSQHGQVQLNGQSVQGLKQAISTGFSVAAVPEKGYKLISLTVRHGVLDGDSISQHVAQYVSQTYKANQLPGGLLSIPAIMVDGEMEFTALFDVDTGISSLEEGVDDEAATPVYNLMGAKVEQPLQPGIYIKKGKKIIVQ